MIIFKTGGILTSMGLGLLEPEPVSLGLPRYVGGGLASSEMVMAGLDSLELRRMTGGIGSLSTSLIGASDGGVSAEPCIIVSICRDLS